MLEEVSSELRRPSHQPEIVPPLSGMLLWSVDGGSKSRKKSGGGEAAYCTQGHTFHTYHRSDNRFPLPSLSIFSMADLFPILYDLAHMARWDPYNLPDLTKYFLGWICTVQILRSLSQRRGATVDYLVRTWYRSESVRGANEARNVRPQDD